MPDAASELVKHGIRPSSQRVAVARYALDTHDHPTADEVFARVKRSCPGISRATIYNTLNLFVDKGLLARHTLSGGNVVYDCVVAPHHHLVDEETGRIHDIPWEALTVGRIARLPGFEVKGYQVVLRGRRTKE